MVSGVFVSDEVCPDLSESGQMQYGLYRRSVPVRTERFLRYEEDSDMIKAEETIRSMGLSSSSPFRIIPLLSETMNRWG